MKGIYLYIQILYNLISNNLFANKNIGNIYKC